MIVNPAQTPCFSNGENIKITDDKQERISIIMESEKCTEIQAEVIYLRQQSMQIRPDHHKEKLERIVSAQTVNPFANIEQQAKARKIEQRMKKQHISGKTLAGGDK